MKSILTILFFYACAADTTAQNYSPADAGSTVKFTIKNFGLNVTGSFKGLQGKILFDSASLTESSFNVSVDATTINTGNGSRDKHLKKDEYFDVADHPKLTFTSTKISSAGKQSAYNVEGRLEIKGISKSISFPFEAIAVAGGYQLTGQFKINRRDFKVGGGSWVLSDELTVSLNVSAVKQ